MAIWLVDEVPCLLRQFPLASTLSASLSHVALHTEYNFLKGYILRFLKTSPVKYLNQLGIH